MYKQPELGFEYDALEPHLDSETLEIHYSKHHAAYCKKFNDAIEGTDLEEKDLKEILENLDSVPEEIKAPVINNGGGAWNHSFFWSVLCSEADSNEPGEKLLESINETFGSFDDFKKQFSEAAATTFGSGWAWLVKNSEGKLEIVKTFNQGSPISEGLKPLLVIDVWEHAYYLKYRNLRPDFIEAFWNVVNWKKVEEYFLE